MIATDAVYIMQSLITLVDQAGKARDNITALHRGTYISHTSEVLTQQILFKTSVQKSLLYTVLYNVCLFTQAGVEWCSVVC